MWEQVLGETAAGHVLPACANDKYERVGTGEQSDDAETESDRYSGEVVNPSLLGPHPKFPTVRLNDC
jgi:hypothetical protein